MRLAAIAAFLLALLTTAYAQTSQVITIVHAVAHNRDEPKGAKELALKEKFEPICNGKTQCSPQARDIVPDDTFLIEVTYVCRDVSGATRQKGPIRTVGFQEIRLTCSD